MTPDKHRRPPVHGVELDAETRCAHWHSARDIVAIKMKCCGVYYSCKDCHDALAGHAVEIWPCCERGQTAVMCGACGAEFSIRQYLQCGSVCPACNAAFNPGCREHYPFYFDMVPTAE